MLVSKFGYIMKRRKKLVAILVRIVLLFPTHPLIATLYTTFLFLLKRPMNPGRAGWVCDMGYDVAPDIRSRRRPKHTVHAANNSRMNDTNVSQNPGPVLVSWSMWRSLSFTYA